MRPRFVFDTSAFINSWRFHYPQPVFPGVWNALGYALAKGEVVSPSEVLVEVGKRGGDPLHTWLSDFDDSFLPPQASWAPHLAVLRGHAPHWFAGTGHDEADPFVVAMAMEMQLPVVTYEGRAFSGDAARIRTERRGMPHVCAIVGVPVAMMSDVLNQLGVVLS